MEKRDRMYLKQGDRLCLKREREKDSGSDCEILEKMGEGSSCVCYRAVFEETEGILKEFYPMEFVLEQNGEPYPLKRTKANQLTSLEEKQSQRFQERCEEFLGGYRKLEQARKKDSRNRILNNYIPVYNILYGDSSEGEGASVYIWSANDKTGETFADYLQMVREQPEEYALQKVFHIINTVITLTDCIKALHSAGLLHLDIKPSNFLVPYNSMFDINSYSISLFDVDTLYEVNSRYSVLAGTEGFVAPEVRRGRGENRSDLFSIGAVLFYSLIVTPLVGDGLYREEYYSQLDQLIQSSDLLNSSEYTSNVFFRACISNILKKCLAKKVRDRYDNCEMLLEDLKQALAYLAPTFDNGKLADARKRWILMEEEEFTEETLTAKIQNLLYKKPLYQGSEKERAEIRVLVLGAGTYAQKFIDLCLQAGQLPGKKLHIAAVSKKSKEEKDIYLQFRPAISSFVNVDGSLDGSEEESYGELHFLPVLGEDGIFSERDLEKNKEALRCILQEEQWEDGADYVFIALQDEELNQQMARAYKSLSLPVSCPVCTYETDCGNKMDKALVQMAFYTHLSWKDSLNIDFQEAYQEFKVPYNYDSSLAYALSVKYKLHSVGIDLEDPKKAAEQFQKKRKEPGILEELSELEHRRWVMEKITNGWQAPRTRRGELDVERCAERFLRTGRTYDKRRKEHPCIVRCGRQQPLQNWNKEDWDQRGSLKELDELDQVSVRLHRILKGRGAKKLYVDYKKMDQTLVDRIPFLLTYQPSPHLVLFLNSKEESLSLAAVASAAMLAPAVVTYLVYCEEEKEAGQLPEKIAAIQAFLERRSRQTQISVLIGWNKALSSKGKRELEERLEAVSLLDFKILECEKEQDAIEHFLEVLSNRRVDLVDVTGTLFQNPMWQQEWRGKAGESYPIFLFDHVEKEFFPDEKCAYLKYIHDNTALSLEDLMALKGVTRWRADKRTKIQNIDQIWNLYLGEDLPLEGREKRRVLGYRRWKKLCLLLRQYSEEQDMRATFVPEKEGVRCIWTAGGQTIQIQAEKGILSFLEAMKERLAESRDPGVYQNPEGSFVWDQLMVEEITVDKKLYELIEQLEQLGLLTQQEKVPENNGCETELELEEPILFSKEDKKVSFSYTSVEGKRLLTCPEQIRGAYLSWKAENKGQFDGIYPGFSYEQNGSWVKIDCVLVSGWKVYGLLCRNLGNQEEIMENIGQRFGDEIRLIEIKDQEISTNDFYNYTLKMM